MASIDKAGPLATLRNVAVGTTLVWVGTAPAITARRRVEGATSRSARSKKGET